MSDERRAVDAADEQPPVSAVWGAWDRRMDRISRERQRPYADQLDRKVVEEATMLLFDACAVLAEQAGSDELALLQRIRDVPCDWALALAIGWALDRWDDPFAPSLATSDRYADRDAYAESDEFQQAMGRFKWSMSELAVQMERALSGWRHRRRPGEDQA
jgi:hypothetical protein